MANARIYQRPKNAMQSGKSRTNNWVLEFESEDPKRPDPLTGWAGGAETREQVNLSFPTAVAAIAYAERAGLTYQVEQPHDRVVRPKSYADNFRFGRTENWTH